MSSLTWTDTQRSQILDHLRAVWPEEGCGFLAGVAGRVLRVYPVENKLHSPVRFQMDERQQLEAMLNFEARGWEMLAIYHSHPAGPAGLSETDRALAYYPEAALVVVSFADRDQPAIRAFRLWGDAVEEIELIVDFGLD